MKKEALYLIMIIIVSSFCYGVFYKELKDQWFSENGTYTIDNTNFTFDINLDQHKVLVNFLDNRLIIPYESVGTALDINLTNTSCAVQDEYEICIEDIDWQSHNAITERSIYKALAQVKKLAITLDVFKRADKTDIIIGEKVKFDLAIKNNGTKKVEIFYFDEDFKDYFKLVESSCPRINNTVYFNAYIEPQRTKTCVYEAIATKASNSYNQRSTIKFYDNVENISRTQDVNFKIHEPPVVLWANLSKNTTHIDDESKLKVNITAKEKVEFKSLMIQIPEGIEILDHSRSLRQQGNTLIYDKTLRQDDTEQFEVTLKARYAGDNQIVIKEDYTYDRVKKDVSHIVNWKVYEPSIYLNYRFPQNVAPGTDLNILIDIVNNDTISRVHGLKPVISSDLSIWPGAESYAELNRGTNIVMTDQQITIPNLRNNTKLWINISLDYETDKGQQLHVDKLDYIYVNLSKIGEGLDDNNQDNTKGESFAEKLKKNKNFVIGAFVVALVVLLLLVGMLLKKQ